MIIAVGSLVYVKSILSVYDELCVVISNARPEFIGDASGHYYYEVYSFESKERFLAFDYEMTHVGKEDILPYFVKE